MDLHQMKGWELDSARGARVGTLRPADHSHPDTVCRAQGDRGKGDEPARGIELQSNAARDAREQQDGFHHREAIPDADARSAAEGEIGESREPGRRTVRPSVRAELERMVEVSGVAMHHPWTHEQDRK